MENKSLDLSDVCRHFHACPQGLAWLASRKGRSFASVWAEACRKRPAFAAWLATCGKIPVRESTFDGHPIYPEDPSVRTLDPRAVQIAVVRRLRIRAYPGARDVLEAHGL